VTAELRKELTTVKHDDNQARLMNSLLYAKISKLETDLAEARESVAQANKLTAQYCDERDEWRRVAERLASACYSVSVPECHLFDHRKHQYHQSNETCQPLENWESALAAFERLKGAPSELPKLAGPTHWTMHECE